MKKLFVIFLMLTIVTLLCSQSLTPEERAKIEFKKAFDLWISGSPEKALAVLESTLYKPIDLRDISKFWYLKARIEVDLGRVEDAIKDLRSVLLIDPASVEVLSYLKELQYLTGEERVEKKLKSKKLFVIKGKKGLNEYFYTINDISIWGDRIYALDSYNMRLLVFKDEKLFNTYNLPFHPIFIETSDSGVSYIVGKSGKLYRFYQGKVDLITDKLSTPILAGFDRSGRIWGVSAFDVFMFDGKDLHTFRLNEKVVAIDCEISFEGVWILDALNRRIALYNFKEGKITENIPLFVDAKAFELTPLGDFILLSKDGHVFLLKDKKELLDTKIKDINITTFEYEFPYLYLSDWRTREISSYLFYMGSPLIVKIDSISYNEDKNEVKVIFRVEDLEGNPVHMLKYITYAVIDGGKRQFRLRFSPQEVSLYKSDINFISDKLELLKRGIGYDVIIPPTALCGRYDIISLRDKSVRLFVNGMPASKLLMRTVRMSGGDVNTRGPLNPMRNFWIAYIPYTPGFSLKITPISIYVILLSEVFSDTVYMVEGGASFEGNK